MLTKIQLIYIVTILLTGCTESFPSSLRDVPLPSSPVMTDIAISSPTSTAIGTILPSLTVTSLPVSPPTINPVNTPQPVSTSTEQVGNPIVFASRRFDTSQTWQIATLFVANINGQDEEQITPSDGFNIDPVWSPDNTQIAFSGMRAGNQDIYIMTKGNMNVRQLTNDMAFDMLPTWSPDGTQLAFVSNRTGEWQIYIMSINTLEVRQLTKVGVNTSPDWSPDGHQIVYVGIRQYSDAPLFSNNLYLIDVDGHNEMKLSNACDGASRDPAWSPDSRLIAFTCEVFGNEVEKASKIHLINSDGTNSRQLTLSDSMANEYRPRWSPDGQQILYVRNGEELFVVNVNTGGVVPLFAQTEKSIISADWQHSP